MCWFITLGVSRKGVATLEEISRARDGLGIRPSLNPHLTALFPATDSLFEITHGQCACALMDMDEADHQEKIRRQYQKKGWSDAKIARALADRHRARGSSYRHGRQSEAKRLLHDLIVRLAQQSGSVRAFAHFYKGSQDEEQISAAGSRHLDSIEFRLSHLASDVLVEVGGSPGARGRLPDDGAHAGSDT